MIENILRLVLFVALVSGCGAGKQGILDPRVSLIDDEWGGDLRLTAVLPVPNRDGLLEVQVNGYNDTSGYKKLQYRIQWFNVSGLVIPTILTRWTDFPAFPNTVFSFSAISPNKEATSFKVLIRDTTP